MMDQKDQFAPDFFPQYLDNNLSFFIPPYLYPPPHPPPPPQTPPTLLIR